ncbi:MAG: hypothetical protein IPM23_13165 [Candidatus Melainabacteria bacterium]|nr:hypothetical protein [Candidatus Melainabacteria bacterium]
MERSEVRFCMRCLTPLDDESRRACFKCDRVTCSSRGCGIWVVLNRIWSCQVCVEEEIDAVIDQHDKKLDEKEDY